MSSNEICLLLGATGVGKTLLLKRLQNILYQLRTADIPVIQRDAETPHYTNLGEPQPTPQVGHTPTSDQPTNTDSGLRTLQVDGGSAENSRYSSMCVSEPCPEVTSEQDDEDNREDLAPLNLSTKNQDKEKSSCDHRLQCSDTEKLKGEELPLNLSIRASHVNSALSTLENLQQRPGTELNEEPCDQRQTAALALCQLATASSAASSCHFSTADPLSEDSTSATSPGSSEKTKHTTKVKAKGIKRANSGQAENNCHKPNKRAKVPGRAARRRPRCC